MSHRHWNRIIDKYMLETELGEAGERSWRLVMQRGSPIDMVADLLYGMVSCGCRMPPFGWLFLKNYCYMASTGAMLTSLMDANAMTIMHPAKYVKDSVMEEVNTKDISNLRESLPEILEYLRPYDRKQVVRALATGEKVTPKKMIWAVSGRADDKRFLEEG